MTLADMSVVDKIALITLALTVLNNGLVLWYALTTARLLRTTRTASYGEVYVWAAERLSNPERIAQRAKVIVEAPTFHGSFFEIPTDLRIAVEETCRTYDLIGIAGFNGMLPIAIITREWGYSIIRTHEACHRFLVELRAERGDLYWNNFTELYRSAKRVWS